MSVTKPNHSSTYENKKNFSLKTKGALILKQINIYKRLKMSQIGPFEI